MVRNRNKIIRSVTISRSLDFCEDIMRLLRSEGYEMIAITSPGPELDKLRDMEGFHCVAVPMERHISIFKDLKSLFLMIKVLLKEKPQVIHSMTPKAGLICMLAGWMTRVPVRIHTFTGLVWPTAKGRKRKILMIIDQLLCSCTTHVIPEGQGVLNDLKNYGICKKPMKVLGYGNVKGVDMERFDPNRFEPSSKEHPFTYVFVGRIVGDKGINELVEAFQMLHDKFNNTKLVLVGQYEHDLDPVNQLTQDRIATNDAIIVCGPKYGDDLLQLYVDADCFVMPSYREGFPNTVMEAGAMGLPSVVTDINGSREIIVEGENGLIIPPRTVEPLYRAMEIMLIDKDARGHMADNARMMIESRFEKSFVQGCLIDFYKEILN